MDQTITALDIIQDARKHILSGRLTPTQGFYTYPKDNEHCDVCAIGALFAALCLRKEQHIERMGSGVLPFKDLSPYFDRMTMAQVESFFEVEPRPQALMMGMGGEVWSLDLKDISELGKAYPDATTRALAILDYLEEGNGTFNPTPLFPAVRA